MVIADIIFPAFLAPYIVAGVMPWAGAAALGAEVVVFLIAYPGVARGWLSTSVVVANVASSAVGIGLALYLPSGVSGGRSSVGPIWKMFEIAAWFLAFVVSIALEYPILRMVTRSLNLKRLFRTVVLANVCSYITLLGVFLLSAWLFRNVL
jgi:hypothetical protein